MTKDESIMVGGPPLAADKATYDACIEARKAAYDNSLLPDQKMYNAQTP